MTSYWIKLYHEILEDPKMGLLPDRLWRRVIELFLCAGIVGKRGELGTTAEIAYRLHRVTDDIEPDLLQLAEIGIITHIESGWHVCKFAERQAASLDAERKRAQRDRERDAQYQGNVTNGVTNRDGHGHEIVRQNTEYRIQNTDTESLINLSINTTTTAPGSCFSLYETEIGPLTPMIADAIKDAQGDYSDNWICDAIKEAAKQNKRTWKYIAGILRNWKRDGRGPREGAPPVERKYTEVY